MKPIISLCYVLIYLKLMSCQTTTSGPATTPSGVYVDNVCTCVPKGSCGSEKTTVNLIVRCFNPTVNFNHQTMKMEVDLLTRESWQVEVQLIQSREIIMERCSPSQREWSLSSIIRLPARLIHWSFVVRRLFPVACNIHLSAMHRCHRLVRVRLHTVHFPGKLLFSLVILPTFLVEF